MVRLDVSLKDSVSLDIVRTAVVQIIARGSQITFPTVRNVAAGTCNFYYGPARPDELYDIRVDAAGYVPWSTGDSPVTFGSHDVLLSVALVPFRKPFPKNLRDWRGAFLIPDYAFPAPFGMEGTRMLWTPAYGSYSDAGIRRQYRQLFKLHKYTHFPYNCAGLAYHDDYGYMPDDPQRVRRDLSELLNDGIIPVVDACDDQDGGSVVPWHSFGANKDLIPIAFPMWEMNGPLGVPMRQPDGSYAGRGMDVIRNTHAAAPKAELYLHFTAGHGAPGYPEERASWRYVRDQFGVLGLLSQDSGYDRALDGDPIGTAAGLTDTASRLAEEGLLNVGFEQCTWPCYNRFTEPKYASWDGPKQRAYGSKLRSLARGIAGLCDGEQL